MKLFLCSLALAFVMEGVCFVLFPGLMRKCMEEVLANDNNSIRSFGVAALCAGIAIAAGVYLFMQA